MVLTFGMVLIWIVQDKSAHDTQIALNDYRQFSNKEALIEAQSLGNLLNSIYQNLRAISYFPDVRSLNGQKDVKAADNNAAIRTLYINTAVNIESTIVVSDFRQVPVDFHPKEGTKDPNEWMLADQMGWLKQNYFSIKNLSAYIPPFISSQTDFCRDIKDSAQAATPPCQGTIFSVPFYGYDNELRGMIAVTLSNQALQKMLPSKNYAIVNTGYHYALLSRQEGQERNSLSWVRQASIDPNLIFSTVVPININDPRGQWLLWVGYPNARFDQTPAAKNIQHFRAEGYWFACLLTLLGCLLLFVLKRSYHATKSREIAEAATKAKGQFLANVSHDIRTPLNGILATTELLETTSLDVMQKKYLSIVSDSGTFLKAILDDLLDASKMEAGHFTLAPHTASLHQIIDRIENMFLASAKTKGLAFKVQADPLLPDRIVTDGRRLTQIISNLVSNAIKYTSQGHVEVHFELKQNSFPKPQLRFSVCDTGNGIPSEHQKNIFDEFTRLKSTENIAGTGLGLSISKYLVEMMGGTIGVSSSVGVGSVFWFEIPLTLAEGAAPDPEPYVEPKSKLTTHYDGLKILVVDDVESNKVIVKDMLTRLGCDVDTVSNGTMAVECSTTGQYDAIFMDCKMPVMDGYAATQYIRRRGDTMPIIALTAQALNDKIQACYAAGMNDVVSKPLCTNELIRVLDTWCVKKATFEEEIALTNHHQNGSPSLHVLLAEDIEVNQRLFAAVFDSIGIDIDIVDDGQAALNRALQQKYDLIFLDCKMPIVDGYAATRLIREKLGKATPPIVALTAHNFQEELQKCRDAGMDDVLQKPVTRQAVADMVARWSSSQISIPCRQA